MPPSTRRVPAPTPTLSMYGAPSTMKPMHSPPAEPPKPAKNAVDLNVRDSSFDPNSMRNRPDSGFGSVYTKSVYGKGIYAPDLATQQEASGSGSQTQARDSVAPAEPTRSSYFANPGTPSTGRDSVAATPTTPASARRFVPLKGSSSIPNLRAQSIRTEPENFVPSAFAPPVPQLPKQYTPLKEDFTPTHSPAPSQSQSFGHSPAPSLSQFPPGAPEPAPAPAPKKKKARAPPSREGRARERQDSDATLNGAIAPFPAPAAAAPPVRPSLEERKRTQSGPSARPNAFRDLHAMVDVDMHPEKYRQAQPLAVLETPEEARERRAKMSHTKGREMENWRALHIYRPPDTHSLTRVIKDEDKVTTLYFLDVEQLSARQWTHFLRLPPGPYTVEATHERGRTLASVEQKDVAKPVEFRMHGRDGRTGHEREESMTMGKDGVVKKTNSFRGIELYQWKTIAHGNMQCEHTVTGEVVAHYRPTAAVSKYGELKVNPAHAEVMDLLVVSAMARTDQLGVSKGFHPGKSIGKMAANIFSGMKSGSHNPELQHLQMGSADLTAYS